MKAKIKSVLRYGLAIFLALTLPVWLAVGGLVFGMVVQVTLAVIAINFIREKAGHGPKMGGQEMGGN